MRDTHRNSVRTRPSLHSLHVIPSPSTHPPIPDRSFGKKLTDSMCALDPARFDLFVEAQRYKNYGDFFKNWINASNPAFGVFLQGSTGVGNEVLIRECRFGLSSSMLIEYSALTETSFARTNPSPRFYTHALGTGRSTTGSRFPPTPRPIVPTRRPWSTFPSMCAK